MRLWIGVLGVLLGLLLSSCDPAPEIDSSFPEESPAPVTETTPTEAKTPIPDPSPTPQKKEDPFAERSEPEATPKRTRRRAANPFTQARTRARSPEKESEGFLEMVSFGSGDEGTATTVKAETEELVLRVIPKGIPVEQSLKATLIGLAAPETPISESVFFEEKDSVLEFAFDRPGDGWIQGRNQIQVLVGEELLGQWDFNIEGQMAEGNIGRAFLHNKPEHTEEDRTEFPSSESDIFLIVETENVPPGTVIQSIWTAVDVKGLKPGKLVSSASVPNEPDRDCLFTFAPPPKGFLKGSYRIEIYEATQLVRTMEFKLR